jgi:hypothetical protein
MGFRVPVVPVASVGSAVSGTAEVTEEAVSEVTVAVGADRTVDLASTNDEIGGRD